MSVIRSRWKLQSRIYLCSADKDVGIGASAAAATGDVTVCASREIDITTAGEDWSVPPLTGEAWRESIDSGALRPPRLSRGRCGRSGSSIYESSCSPKELMGIRGGGPETERHGRDDKGSGGEIGLLVVAPPSNHAGMEDAATSGRRRLNGKNRRAPGEPSGSSEMGPDAHDVSVFGMSTDGLGSSKSGAAFLKVDRRRVEKSLKSTVLERTARRMLG